ncbi:MAG: hypothetical protein IT330_17865 [Anaerolineae bacterium]|nr:hypothetical protein [Anaerolineae bacterium]
MEDRMTELIAHKMVNNEDLHFVIVEECYSDGGEPFTLFVHANHFSQNRTERARSFFNSLDEALAYCQQQYDIGQKDWQSEVRFVQDFHFEYGVTNLGSPQPYLFGLEDGQVIFRMTKAQDSEDNWGEVLNICGDREGLRRLAAMILLCADGERYDDGMHIHLDDKDGVILPDFPVNLRNPAYLESLVSDDLREGSTAWRFTQ